MRRKHFFIAAMVATLLTSLLVNFASAQDRVVPYRTQRGDTLSSIARKYCTSWQDIFYNNQGILGNNSDVLRVGVLIYVADHCTQASGVYDRGPSTYARGTVSGNVYAVAGGDTWYSIGVRFGLPWVNISNANGGGVLYGGRRLVIPGLNQGQAPARPPVVRPDIHILNPHEGAILPGAFTVSGTAQGLLEGNVIVQALDRSGGVLAQAFASAQGANVATGGSGTWTTQLSVNVPPGTPGSIVATGGGVDARSSIAVMFGGQVAAPAPGQANSNITRFTVNRQQINPGECVTFNWSTRNTGQVYFYREGEFWQDNPVAPNPSHFDVCPRNTSTHFLRVIGDRGLTEIRTITIWVGEPQHGGIGPAIPSLVASPAAVNRANRCTTLLWSTEGTDVARMTLFRNHLAVAGPELRTSFQDCVPDSELGGDIIYELRLEGRTSGWTIRQVRVTSAR